MMNNEINLKFESKSKKFQQIFMSSSKGIKKSPEPSARKDPSLNSSFLQQQLYLKLYGNVQKLCDAMSLTPTIEFEQEPSLACKPPAIPLQALPPTQKKIKYIINSLKKRIKAYSGNDTLFISPKRLAFQSFTSEKLGPGSYISRASEFVESHEFSSIPRLKTPISHNLFSLDALQPKNSSASEIIKRNKQRAAKLSISKELAVNRTNLEKSREIEVKKNKTVIEGKKKTERIEKLSRKMRLFDWRMMNDEVVRVKKFWMCFIVTVGFTRVILYKAHMKKLLKAKWEIYLSNFVVISKIIARFMIRLKRIRKRFVEKTILSLCDPFIDHFRTKILESKRVLAGYIEIFNKKSFLYMGHVKFKYFVLLIQRNVRDYLQVKKSRLAVLIALWEARYTVVLSEISQASSTKFSQMNRFGPIKGRERRKDLLKHMMRQIKSYIAEKKSYRRKLREFQTSTAAELGQVAFTIKKPVFRLYHPAAKIDFLIKSSLKARSKEQMKERHEKFGAFSSPHSLKS